MATLLWTNSLSLTSAWESVSLQHLNSQHRLDIPGTLLSVQLTLFEFLVQARRLEMLFFSSPTFSNTCPSSLLSLSLKPVAALLSSSLTTLGEESTADTHRAETNTQPQARQCHQYPQGFPRQQSPRPSATSSPSSSQPLLDLLVFWSPWNRSVELRLEPFVLLLRKGQLRFHGTMGRSRNTHPRVMQCARSQSRVLQ